MGFNKRAKDVLEKKKEITKDLFDNYVEKKTSIKDDDDIEKELLEYARKITKLEKKKFNIKKNITIGLIHDPKVRGYSEYYSKPQFANQKFHFGPEIYFNLSNVVSQLKSDKIEDRTNAIVKYVQTIHHELTHVEQHVATEMYKVEGISQADALQFGREFAAKDFMRDEYYRAGNNYNKQFIERDARFKGFTDASGVLPKLENGSNLVTVTLARQLQTDDAFVETEKLEFRNKEDDRDVITTDIVDKAVKSNPAYYLKKYPILKGEYNSDGSRKELYALIKNSARNLYRIKNNPFIAPKLKKKAMERAKNYHSLVIAAELKSNSEEELKKAQQMLGPKRLKAAYSICSSYYKRESDRLKEKAVEEKQISMALGETQEEADKKFAMRIEKINDRYSNIIEEFENKCNFFEQGGYEDIKKYSSIKATQQAQRDRKSIKQNLKAMYGKATGSMKSNKESLEDMYSKYKRNGVFEEAEAEAEDYDLSDINAMLTEYKDIEQGQNALRDKYKNEYNYLKAQDELEDRYKNNRQDITYNGRNIEG